METKIRHMRIPENVCKLIEQYAKENNISTFTQAVVSIITAYFKNA